MRRITRWMEEAGRRGLARLDAWANALYGSKWNPLYHSGAIVVVLMLVLLATGLYLLLFYRIGSPWASVAGITGQAWGGRWIRGLHRFASDAAMVAAGVHAFRMFAQDRAWGARALAWLSGVVLVGVILLCGWTGYVMVWDSHAYVLAVEGARLLDALPIFSEPIGRSFVGEAAVPAAFFFLNLFVHIALPIGLGLLLWVHVSRVARPRLLPHSVVTWSVVGGLTALAVVWPLGIAPEANPFRVAADVPLDVFFGFWLPVTERLPAGWAWALGGVSTALVLLVPWWARPAREARPAPSVVNERVCTGCEQCMYDCPFDAIGMIPSPREADRTVARVDPSLCVSCGICIGSCAPMALGPRGGTGRDQLAGVRAFLEREKPGPGDVVLVGCWWSASGAMSEPPPGVVPYPVQCAGSVHTSTLEFIVRSGAGGVLVASCPPGECRGREGPKWLNARVDEGREAELKDRVDRERVLLVEASAGEVPLLHAAAVDFVRHVRSLRPAVGEEEIDIMALCDAPEGVAP